MIRNIWAVGRNYTDHARELGNSAPSPDSEPMIFLKAGSCVVKNGGKFRLPFFSQNVDHEVELAFRFGPRLDFDALSIAIDLTARDVQSRLKSQSHPWELSKTFQDACLLGEIRPFDVRKTDPQSLSFKLRVDGALKQSGQARDMIHPVEKLRQYILERFPVVEGDWLLTGTPAGVAAIQPGNHLEAEIENLLRGSWHAALASA